MHISVQKQYIQFTLMYILLKYVYIFKKYAEEMYTYFLFYFLQWFSLNNLIFSFFLSLFIWCFSKYTSFQTNLLGGEYSLCL